MPRYFFDIRDTRGFHRDDYGAECDSFDDARDQAQGLLPHIAGEQLPDGDFHDFVCEMRDDAGRLVYRAELTYRGTRLTGDGGGAPSAP